MDRWVKENMIHVDVQLVDDLLEDFNRRQEEKKKVKEASKLNHDEHSGMTEDELRHFMKVTRLKTIEFIQFGETTMEAWYHSDFPQEYHCRVLYICPFTLQFFKHKAELESHSERCDVRCPPGDEIYRDETLSVFEFDAKQ